jgi:prolipoprotein diacylglyceryltransferase
VRTMEFGRKLNAEHVVVRDHAADFVHERARTVDLPPDHRFQFCGYFGVALAMVLVMTLVGYNGLSRWTMAGIIGTAIATFLALVTATKIVVGEERIIYYHHEIAVVAGTSLFLRLIHQPVLPYLDITLLGIGLFLACGRIGCLLVGCCHGRPFRFGVCYGENHANAGFTPYYVGIPLFPVQALESLWALGLVLAGTSMILRGDAPGSALTLYIIVYGFGRFCFEFLRGDPDRPYFLGFSEAQWISGVLMSAIVYEETIHALPLFRWHVATIFLVIAMMIGIAVRRRLRRTPTYLLLRPKHVREIADALRFALAAPSATGTALGDGSQIYVGVTSLGVQISASKIAGRSSWISHYALSSRNKVMSPDLAQGVANLICLLSHANRDQELVQGNRGVYHLFVPRQ